MSPIATSLSNMSTSKLAIFSEGGVGRGREKEGGRERGREREREREGGGGFHNDQNSKSYTIPSSQVIITARNIPIFLPLTSSI